MSASRYYMIQIAKWHNKHLTNKVPVKGKKEETEQAWAHELKKLRVRRGQIIFPLRPKEVKEEIAA